MAKTTKAGAAAPLIEKAREQLRRWRRFGSSDERQLVALVAGVPPGLLREDASPEAERAVMLELATTFEEVAKVAHAHGLALAPAVDFARNLRAIVGRIVDARASMVARHARGGRPTNLERQALHRRAWAAESLLRELELVSDTAAEQPRPPSGDRFVLASALVRPDRKGRHNTKAVRAFAESNGVENEAVGQRRYVDQQQFEAAWRQVERAGSQHLERIDAAKREARRKKEAQGQKPPALPQQGERKHSRRSS